MFGPWLSGDSPQNLLCSSFFAQKRLAICISRPSLTCVCSNCFGRGLLRRISTTPCASSTAPSSISSERPVAKVQGFGRTLITPTSTRRSSRVSVPPKWKWRSTLGVDGDSRGVSTQCHAHLQLSSPRLRVSAPIRSRANMALIRQSRPGSSVGSQ